MKIVKDHEHFQDARFEWACIVLCGANCVNKFIVDTI